MPRPRLRRWVAGEPKATFFKPQGVPLRKLEEVRLAVEGLEALRLADLEGLNAEEAAARMGVSRHTFGRVLAEAHRQVARALVSGAALRIGGGHYGVSDEQQQCAGDPEEATAFAARQAGDARLTEEILMRQNCGNSRGRGGGGQGRCGQGQGQGQGRGGQGRCGQGGQGRGSGGAGRGGGFAAASATPQAVTDVCVCPQCGQTVPHTPGTACTAMQCPACGAAMVRK